jgi:phosphoglycolate phosphatase-like HAD superfamily hydrolase
VGAFLPGTQIEVVRDFPRGRFKHVLFDFDGTLSLLREGWQAIMAPVCIEMICGDHPPTPQIERAVWDMIDETTGVQTILQMEHLVDLVRAFGLVPEERILDAHGYKEVYNARLMVPVRARIARLDSGEFPVENMLLHGAREFLELMAAQGVAMYVFSGTDQDDVIAEAERLDLTRYFREIWGALRTVEEYSKEQVVRDIIAQHELRGPEVLAIGDGPVELRSVKACGGVALGVASDEETGHGWNAAKCNRLLHAGADLIVPDFREAAALIDYLFAR